MAFLPKPGEKIDDNEQYDLSGDEDDRLRQGFDFFKLETSTKPPNHLIMQFTNSLV